MQQKEGTLCGETPVPEAALPELGLCLWRDWVLWEVFSQPDHCVTAFPAPAAQTPQFCEESPHMEPQA